MSHCARNDEALIDEEYCDSQKTDSKIINYNSFLRVVFSSARPRLRIQRLRAIEENYETLLQIALISDLSASDNIRSNSRSTIAMVINFASTIDDDSWKFMIILNILVSVNIPERKRERGIEGKGRERELH